MTWLLHEDGVDLNGIVLQSSILDFSQRFNPVGLIPTFAADAWFHKKVTVSPFPTDLDNFMKKVEEFTSRPFANIKATYTKGDPAIVQILGQYIGIPPEST